MVRVGGGWVSLNEFLHKHDPCRCKLTSFIWLKQTIVSNIIIISTVKGRTNIELREQLTDSEGKKSLFNDDGTISAIGPITKVHVMMMQKRCHIL